MKKYRFTYLLLSSLFIFLFAKESTELYTVNDNVYQDSTPKEYLDSTAKKENKDSIPYPNIFTKVEQNKTDEPIYSNNNYEKGVDPEKLDYYQKNWISKYTNNFEELYNSFISIPEYKKTEVFQPNMFNEVDLIDPSMGIQLIEPPTANNKGIVNLAYEIEIPKGRNGMQPKLNIGYNQNLENGWMGLGWALEGVDAIEIDTRWGAPQYDSQYETETYLLDKEQLIQANGILVRKQLKTPRSAEQEYRKRAESDFKKVIRHGNATDNYWWEVIDKKGVKYFYGGLPGLGIVESSVLRVNGNSGAIAHWSLVEQRDLNDNFIRYTYQKVQDTGLGNGTAGVPGFATYLKKITYTGNAAQEGKYSIDFITDRDLSEGRRKDVRIDTRKGFKEVTADLLRRIVVKYNNQPIRSYGFSYTEGAFYKTLLDEIINYDLDGVEFAKHKLEYYDDVRKAGDYEPYFSQENIDFVESDLEVTVEQPGLNHFSYGKASALSGVRAVSSNGSIGNTFFYVGGCAILCPIPDLVTPVATIAFSIDLTTGTSFGISSLDVESAVRLIDINGDNLPDRLIAKGNTTNANQKTEVNLAKLKEDGLGVEYKDTVSIDFNRFGYGIEETIFSTSESRLFSFIGEMESRKVSRSITYMSDVNGDGLSDFVTGSSVQFNCKPNNGRPNFSLDVNCTPNPILAGEIDIDVLPDVGDFLDQVSIILPPSLSINSRVDKNSSTYSLMKKLQQKKDINILDERINIPTKANKDSKISFASNRQITAGSISGGVFEGVSELGFTKSTSSSIILSGSSNSTMEKALSYRDINGDQYPDILSTEGIQYTNSLGQIDEFVPQNFISHNSEADATGTVEEGGYLFANQGRSALEQSGKTQTDPEHLVLDSKILGQNISTTNLSAAYTHQSGSQNPKSTDKVLNTLMDINGDGLLDICNSDGTVQLGTGYGFLPLEQWVFLINEGSSSERKFSNNSMEDKRSILSPGMGDYNLQKSISSQSMKDINGDGLIDRIEEVSSQGAWVRLNTGNGFADRIFWKGLTSLESSNSLGESQSSVFSFTLILPPSTVGVSFSFGNFLLSGFSKEEIQISDINGDGYPDILESNELNQVRASYSTIQRTNLLRKVNRPLGSSFTVDYSRKGNTYSLPDNKWVMQKVALEQSTNDPTDDGYNNILTTFEYGEGNYQRHDRVFMGFDFVRTIQHDENNNNEPYRILSKIFDSKSYYNRGKLLEESIADKNNQVFVKTTFNYRLFDISNGDLLPIDFEESIENVCAFSALVQKENIFFSDNNSLETSNRISFTYDIFGNIKSFTDRGNPLNVSDDYTATLQYHQVGTTNVLSIPQNINIEDVAGNTLRYRSTEIDSRGNIIAINDLMNEPSSFATYNLSYNSLGNLSSIQLPENHKNQRLTYNYSYENDVDTYINRVEDSYGYISNATYDPRFGVQTRSSDINNQSMEYDLDKYGRKIRLRGPNEIAASLGYLMQVEYVPNLLATQDLSYILSRHFDPEHNAEILKYDFFDSYQRHLQTKKNAVITDQDGKSENTYTVSGREVFDSFGRLVEKYRATSDNTSPDVFSTSFSLTPPKKNEFDVLDRIVKETSYKQNLVTRYLYDIVAQNSINILSLGVIDPEGNKEDYNFNSRGRLFTYIKPSSLGFGFGNRYNYRYDAIGQLIESSDLQYTFFQKAYNLLGKTTSIDYIDQGKVEYAYDFAGNLIEERNEFLIQKIKSPIVYAYDFNRLSTIKFPKNSQNNIEYRYGAAGSANSSAGRVELQLDASGGREFSYGPIGELAEEVRTVVASLSDIFTYKTSWAYDSWNRIQKMLYPDGEELDYQYNTSGYLLGMSGVKNSDTSDYVSEQGYNVFAQPVYRKYGNTTKSRYWYDENGERTRIVSSTLLSGSTTETVFLDENYTYDKSYNLLKVENLAQNTTAIGLLGGKSSQTFTYDNQYRLINTSGKVTTFSNNSAEYDISMSYNTNNNLVSKNQNVNGFSFLPRFSFQYNYKQDYVNLLNAISASSYNFDLNGNISEIRNRPELLNKQYLWDETNDLKVINDNGFISQYTYDADGNRIIKSSNIRSGVFVNGAPAGLISHNNNYTLYIGKHINVKVEGFSKHYYFGEERVVSKNGNGKFLNSDILLTGITAGNVDYFNRFKDFVQMQNQELAAMGIPPGPPTTKGIYGQPDARVSSSGANNKYENGNTGPPGTPVFIGNIGTVVIPLEEIESYWYHQDFFRNTCYITNRTGQISRYVTYTPFGEIFLEEKSTDFLLDQEYLFRSKEYDKETNLYRFGNRYYNPNTTHWLNWNQ